MRQSRCWARGLGLARTIASSTQRRKPACAVGALGNVAKVQVQLSLRCSANATIAAGVTAAAHRRAKTNLEKTPTKESLQNWRISRATLFDREQPRGCVGRQVAGTLKFFNAPVALRGAWAHSRLQPTRMYSPVDAQRPPNFGPFATSPPLSLTPPALSPSWRSRAPPRRPRLPQRTLAGRARVRPEAPGEARGHGQVADARPSRPHPVFSQAALIEKGVARRRPSDPTRALRPRRRSISDVDPVAPHDGAHRRVRSDELGMARRGPGRCFAAAMCRVPPQSWRLCSPRSGPLALFLFVQVSFPRPRPQRSMRSQVREGPSGVRRFSRERARSCRLGVALVGALSWPAVRSPQRAAGGGGRLREGEKTLPTWGTRLARQRTRRPWERRQKECGKSGKMEGGMRARACARTRVNWRSDRGLQTSGRRDALRCSELAAS